jgi:hypothetical protein
MGTARARRWHVVAAIFCLTVSGCGGAPSLAETDPEGYAACRSLVEARTWTDQKAAAGAVFAAGEHASRATTAALREAAEPLFDEADLEGTGEQVFLPGDGLEPACEALGVEVPPVRERPTN